MRNIDVDRAIDVLNRQIGAIEAQQKAALAPPKKGAKKSPLEATRLTSQVMTMARGLAALLAEIRKTGERAEEQLGELTPERVAELTLKLVARLSPEHRAAVALRIEELDGKVISHGA